MLQFSRDAVNALTSWPGYFLVDGLRECAFTTSYTLHIQLTGVAVSGGRHPGFETDLAKGGVAYVTVPGAVRIRGGAR
jgi:hypothetical protein